MTTNNEAPIEPNEEKARHAIQALHTIECDLATAYIFKSFEQNVKMLKSLSQLTLKHEQLFFETLWRSCFYLIIIGLDKFKDIHTKYQRNYPKSALDKSASVVAWVTKKQIAAIRNKYVAHLIDKKLKRPLSNQEAKEKIQKIVGEDIEHFLTEVNNPLQQDPSTIVKRIQMVRVHISEFYKITIPLNNSSLDNINQFN